MFEVENKRVIVIGLGSRGQAACELLCYRGASVLGVDREESAALRAASAGLRALGVDVELSVTALPKGRYDLAVISPSVRLDAGLVQSLIEQEVPLISELELGYQYAKCLGVAIAGTNGKRTTGEILERILRSNHRKASLCGGSAVPVCTMVERSKDLDFLLMELNVFQLEATRFFRPAVGVLLNLAADHQERYATAREYTQANARLFANQQTFDWAIVQSEALAQFRALGHAVPAKTITFSATDATADLYLDRGLLISRLANWPGPLLDMDHCQLRGPHNAENIMAALAVGHVLRFPLESMVDPVKTYNAGPHRCELVAEYNGVQFINDAKASNIDALQKALVTVRPGRGGEANTWLIAGGHEPGVEYHDLGPILSRRVKKVFLVGESSEKIRAAWSLFTPCTVSKSLVEAINEAAKNAVSGDVVLFSPACSSLDQFRSYQHRGETFCQAVKSISRGASEEHPNMHGKMMIM
jgi:UDP-N-acetylmuramoylalanine--D-glutamate ligase